MRIYAYYNCAVCKLGVIIKSPWAIYTALANYIVNCTVFFFFFLFSFLYSWLPVRAALFPFFPELLYLYTTCTLGCIPTAGYRFKNRIYKFFIAFKYSPYTSKKYYMRDLNYVRAAFEINLKIKQASYRCVYV